MTTMNNESRFLCYLDILGFQDRIAKDRFRQCYESLTHDVKGHIYGDYVYLISDSIIVISEDFEELVAKSFSIYSSALEKGLLIRGAVTKGQINELSSIQEKENIIVIPYLGEAFLLAHQLEKNLNCAGICIDNLTYNELKPEEKELIFSYKELFSKDNKKEEKLFIISDMKNWSVPQTILFKISEQIKDISKHDVSKFLDTFCLYYKVMKEKHGDKTNLEKYHKWWIDILNKL